MAFTPLGIVYLLLLIFILLQCKSVFMNLLLLSTVSDIFLDMGYVFCVGRNTMDFCELPRHILLLYCIIKIFNGYCHLSRNWFSLAFFSIIPIVLLWVSPSNVAVADFNVSWDAILLYGEKPAHPQLTSAVFGQTRVFLTSMLLLVVIYQKFRTSDYLYYLSKLSKIINVFLVLGVIELIVKNIFHASELWGNMMEFLWGKSDLTSYVSQLNRGDYYDLNLFTREPSHWAYSLFICLMIKFVSNIVEGKVGGIDKYLILALILMVCTLAFSSLLFLFFFFCYFLLYRWCIYKPRTMVVEKYVLYTFIILMMLFLTSLLIKYSDGLFATRLLFILDNFTSLFSLNGDAFLINFDNGANLSVQIRIISIVQTIMAFFSRPIFGFSLGSMTSHGSTALFFAGVGVVGVCSWMKFVFYSIPLNKMFVRNTKLYNYSIILYLGLNMFNGLALRPFYDLSLFVIVLVFIFMLSDIRRFGFSRQSSVSMSNIS